MADFTGKGGGLLSRVASLVKTTTKQVTNWGDLDGSIAASSLNTEITAHSKEAVKEMLDRKRHNFYIRKREFDALRKIRQRASSGGGDLSYIPSVFVNSVHTALPVEARAETMQKINAIEEQMADVLQRTPQQPARARAARAFAETEPVRLQADATGQAKAAPAAVAADLDMALTSGSAPLLADIDFSNYSAPDGSIATGAEASSIIHDAELEEAAILFANGEDDAAEASLSANIAAGNTRISHEPSWLALFDFYRATGRQSSYEQLASDFALRFDRSAPQWYSMPAMVEDYIQSQQISGSQRNYGWRAPARLNAHSVATMQTILTRQTPPWCIDWTPLQAIEDDAVLPLHILVSSWIHQPIELQFSGIASLERALEAGTAHATAGTPQDRWQLRLLIMRLMQRDADFEVLALDFCILYEISPPTWEGTVNTFVSLDEQDSGMHALVSDTVLDTLQGNTISSHLAPDSRVLARVDLAGHIAGSAESTLAMLDQRRQGQSMLVIDCTKLIRIDFTAAGNILNWVIENKQNSIAIQFRNVHRLVAALFDALGISEQVPVVLNTN